VERPRNPVASIESKAHVREQPDIYGHSSDDDGEEDEEPPTGNGTPRPYGWGE
jgi:hypothetical protein